MTVKLRLTLAFVALLTAATAVVGAVAVWSAHEAMVRRVDDRVYFLLGTPLPSERRPPPDGPPPGSSRRGPYRETAELIVAPDGTVTYADAAGYPDAREPLPKLPADVAELIGRGIRTLPAVDGSLRYRALAARTPAGEVRVAAASLADVDDETRRLAWIVIAATLGALALGGAAAWLVVRRGLRPVDRMIATAGAIAAGDLSQRVETTGDRTELGRLGAALDEMLAQLERADAEREESRARLRRFVADASHELRTPLATIRGYAELCRRGGAPPGEALERALGRIESESARMGKLVESLLLLARLDQHQPLERERVDLARLVEDAVADFRAVEPGRAVELSLAGPAPVVGDEARLRQVLANLLANVRVHTPPNTAVRVSLDGSDTDVTVTVADEGPGLTEEDAKRVFERFYRTDASRARDTGGSGLGLSIVAAVVSAHGGRVEVGAAGGGAAFTVRLPRAARAPV